MFELMAPFPIEAQEAAGEVTDEKLAWAGSAEVGYLFCTEDAAIPLFAQEMMVEKARESGVEVREWRVKSGHSPFLSMPEKVAEVVAGFVSIL